MRIIEVNNSEVVLQEFKTLRNSIYPYYIALAIVAGLLLISNKIPRAELQKSPYSIVLNWIILGATLTTISYAVARMFYDLGHVFKLI